MWLKGTLNDSRILPSTQTVYATVKILKWQFYQINTFEARKKLKTFLKYCFYTY